MTSSTTLQRLIQRAARDVAAMAADPTQHPDTAILSAQKLCQQGKYNEAVLLCNEILKRDCRRYEAYEILAEAFERLGMPAEAVEILNLGTRHLPRTKVRPALIRLAALAQRHKQWKPAEKALRRLLRFRDHREQAHLMLCELYLEMRKIGKVIEHAKATLKLNPRSLPALHLLTSAYLNQNDLPGSIRAAAAAVQISPTEPVERFKLGALYHQAGDVHNALEQYERLLTMHPESTFADAAEEAIANIEQYHFREVIIRSSEDIVFRTKLQRDVEDTLTEYGYPASLGLVALIRSVPLEDWTRSRSGRSIRVH